MLASLALEKHRQQVEQRLSTSLARLSSMSLSDHDLASIQRIAAQSTFSGRALHDRWEALCAAPSLPEDVIVTLERLDVDQWMPPDRQLDSEWQGLLCQQRDKFAGSVVEVHTSEGSKYFMFVYATKKPLMPYWLPLEPVEVVLPCMEDCVSDALEPEIYNTRCESPPRVSM